jgi:hypothetical protein
VNKYIKQGGSKYPKKAVKRGGEGEDQPSPRLEAMGSVQMVWDKCRGVHEAGGGVVMLWEKDKGCRSGGWGAGGRVTHYCLPQPPEAWET